MKIKSPYHINIQDVPICIPKPPQQGRGGNVELRIVYGSDIGIMVGSRSFGYHSKPHFHDAEQFNYILSGEIWFFIEDEGFLCKSGDILRIPRNKVHWTWCKHPDGVQFLEAHCPALIGDADLAAGALSMLGSDEDSSKVLTPINEWVQFDKVMEVERRAGASD